MSTHCKSCFHEIDANTAIEDENAKPKPNDLSICFYCGQVSVFDDDINLRPITEDEMKQIEENDYDNWMLLIRTSVEIKKRIKNN